MAEPRTGRRPVGTITRGTTNPNRLRRIDRWLAGPGAAAFRATAYRPSPCGGDEPGATLGTDQAHERTGRESVGPLIVDLGYGASPITTYELAARLLPRVLPRHPAARVLGLEIDPARVAAARELESTLAARFAPEVVQRTSFALGGFELPTPDGAGVAIIRAANVLRQYDESQVPQAWERLRSRLSPGGLLLDATCDEIGRLAAWVALDADGPVSLTLSLSLRHIGTPSDVAPRLPKALIHHNVPGERVHDFLTALDRAWASAAPLSAYGPRQRFLATAQTVKDAGWPLLDGPARWRLGEITVAWEAVAPRP